MRVRVHFRCVLVVLGSVQVMPMSDLGMVRGLLVIACLVVPGSFTMMFGRMLMVMRGLLVMFMNVVTVHRSLPGLLHCEAGALPGIDEVFATRVCQIIAKGHSSCPAPTGSELR